MQAFSWPCVAWATMMVAVHLPDVTMAQNAPPAPVSGTLPAFCANSQFAGKASLLNLCLDTVRVEAFYGNSRLPGHGYQSSGIVVSARGEILTADHNMHSPNLKTIDVMFLNGEHRSAVMTALNEKFGLVLLKIRPDGPNDPILSYHTITLASSDSTPYTPTVTFGYEDHNLDPEEITGQQGEDSYFGQVNGGVLNEETPNIDRGSHVVHVYMHVQHGMSGAGIADSQSGALLGILQFGTNAHMSNGKIEGQEALATPASNVSTFLAANSSPSE